MARPDEPLHFHFSTFMVSWRFRSALDILVEQSAVLSRES